MTDPATLGETDLGISLADLDYPLPRRLIAQHPAPQRDASRMLIVRRGSSDLLDSRVTELPKVLHAGDLLVLNDTKVLPAKIRTTRRTGGKIGGLFTEEIECGLWQVMLEGSRRLRVGEVLTADSRKPDETVTLTLLQYLDNGFWRVGIDPPLPAVDTLGSIGRTPLPPYIERGVEEDPSDDEDRSRYQTIYARRPGAVAAPTAGLHLTGELLESLKERGIDATFVTLHVGVGTFKPIDAPDLSQHRMHAERYRITRDAADAIHRCRARGGRIIAVGTTSVRVLESTANARREGETVRPGEGMTDVFIHPPYRFRAVDGLLTNFHLPKSTLLALVMALADAETIKAAYRHAMEQEYRFYSYGDAMLIL